MQKHLKPGTRAERSFAVDRAAIDEAARTVTLAFSSEAPYERWWGVEILDHSPQSIRLGRLTAGGPLLMDHDSRDHVGVVESVSIDPDRVGRAVVRFGKSARAEEIFQDVKDGIRRSVSVGYMIHKAVLQEESDGLETYRVSDWEPHEVSIVSVPADASVGIGRSAGEADPRVAPAPAAPTENPPMEKKTMPDINVEEVQASARNAGLSDERKRAADIIAIGEQYKLQELAAKFVRDGSPVEKFQAAAIEALSSRAKPSAEIGLTDKEAKAFSFVKAINAACALKDGKFDQAKKIGGFELEVSNAVAEKTGKESRGFYVPQDVLSYRDLTVGTASAGGDLVATNLLASSFIDLLRNRSVLNQMGITTLDGLVGNIAIPRQTGGATVYWVAENGAPTEGALAFDQVTMSPKTAAGYVDMSRKLLQQSSIGVEALVRGDLAAGLALEFDRVGLHGSGASNQPTGIVATSGIGDVAGGTNGAAPAWAHIVELWSDVAVANAAVGRMGFLTNNKVAGKLMTTEKASGTAQFVCPGFPDENGVTNFGGMRAVVSNQVASNLTKGTASGICSAILFGNWADLIMGMWGSLDVLVDPYSQSTTGAVRVVAFQDVDIAVRHAESFSAMLDALTT